MDICDCGHPPSPHGSHTTGTAITPDNREICWTCADELILQSMREHGVVTGYLSQNDTVIETCSGGKLAEVVYTKVSKVGFGRMPRTYYRAVDVYGRLWYGCVGSNGNVTSMKLARAHGAR
jgi:hypothetical protein